MAHPAIPRLPVWRLHIMREEAKRRVNRTREAYQAALEYERAVDRAIDEREHEGTTMRWAGGTFLDEFQAYRRAVDEIDVRGFMVPYTKCPPQGDPDADRS